MTRDLFYHFYQILYTSCNTNRTTKHSKLNLHNTKVNLWIFMGVSGCVAVESPLSRCWHFNICRFLQRSLSQKPWAHGICTVPPGTLWKFWKCCSPWLEEKTVSCERRSYPSLEEIGSMTSLRKDLKPWLGLVTPESLDLRKIFWFSGLNDFERPLWWQVTPWMRSCIPSFCAPLWLHHAVALDRPVKPM